MSESKGVGVHGPEIVKLCWRKGVRERETKTDYEKVPFSKRARHGKRGQEKGKKVKEIV